MSRHLLALPRRVVAELVNKSSGKGSLDSKFVARFEGVDFTEDDFNETISVDGQLLRRHRNGGGWVPVEQSGPERWTITPMPFVAATAYVGPHARVTGAPRIYGAPRITDNARVSESPTITGGTISGNSRVGGCSRIVGNPEITDNAQVGHYALVKDSSKVVGNAKIGGHVIIQDQAVAGGEIELSDQHMVTGSAVVMGPDDMNRVRRYISL
jgi:UDP-3-O-[3-hydroxymyristoyl] glucosamine N-acyltransferase